MVLLRAREAEVQARELQGLNIKQIIGPAVVIEDRPLMGAAREEREQFARDFAESLGEARTGGRRRFLARLALGAGGAVGVALLAPVRSLGPGTENELFETPWSAGERVVGEDGEPIRADSIIPDQVLTVFPESAPRSADGQAVLIGLRPDLFAPGDLPAETVENTVCYSKICTHAGCPVGLYRASAGQLLCPCHQSTFDVYDGAEPVSGPAGRALPQLPLGVDDEGFLVAAGEFIAPVGPTFWNFTDDPETA